MPGALKRCSVNQMKRKSNNFHKQKQCVAVVAKEVALQWLCGWNLCEGRLVQEEHFLQSLQHQRCPRLDGIRCCPPQSNENAGEAAWQAS